MLALPALSSGFPARWMNYEQRLAARALTSAGRRERRECSLLRPVFDAVRAEARWLILIAPPHVLHAPAWIGSGADGAHLVVIAPRSPRDLLWAAEQSLSVAVVGAVLCWADAIVAAQAVVCRSPRAPARRPAFCSARGAPARRTRQHRCALPCRLEVAARSAWTSSNDADHRSDGPLLGVARPSAWRGKPTWPVWLALRLPSLALRSPRPRAVA